MRLLQEKLLKSRRWVENQPLSPRIFAQLDPDALKSNYRAISELIPDASILPMLKADAYGHGAVWAGRTLLEMPALYGFGVATLEEGVRLREGLGPRARNVRILVFSGAAPWTEEKGRVCESQGLVPVLASDVDVRSFLRQKWHERIRYELKFNTGMNRLGIGLPMVRELLKIFRSMAPSRHPDGVCSHLAVAEDPLCKQSVQQRERFLSVRRELSGVLHSAQFHLGNSAAIWNQKLWDLGASTDAVRPGISLYGIPPWRGAPNRGISAVLTLRASVIAVQKIKKGEKVGYGGTFSGSAENGNFIAILGAGYADGIKRSLSNRGWAWLNGKPTRFAGTVSMDLCAVEASSSTRVGDWVELFGPNIDPWTQAEAAQTIPYELLTSLSAPRVVRGV